MSDIHEKIRRLNERNDRWNKKMAYFTAGLLAVSWLFTTAVIVWRLIRG